MTQPADPDFRNCLSRGLIKPFPEGSRAVDKELAAARKTLGTARGSLGRADLEWATAQAYYAAFHAGRALLYLRGYRESSHVCLWIALKALYVSEGRLPFELVERAARAKRLRESANYDSDYSVAGAEEAIGAAEDLVNAAVRETGQHSFI